MNFDNIIVTKHLGKDKLCLDYLQPQASYPSTGVTYYQLNKLNRIVISHNEISNKIRVNANIPYCFLGHNCFATIDDFFQGFQSISEDLNVNLFDADVNLFEFGSFQKISFPTKDFLNNHIGIPEMETRIFPKGKDFEPKENKTHKIKLYDAGNRMKSVLNISQRNILANDFGYNPKNQYVKIEIHYMKPETYFKIRNLKLKDLFKSEFITTCKNDLLTKYQSIMKTGNIKIPASKGKLSSSVIPLICLREMGQIYGFNPDEAIKTLIKAIPEGILTKDDKKARNRQIRNNMKLIQTAGESVYDISELLKAKINHDQTNPFY